MHTGPESAPREVNHSIRTNEQIQPGHDSPFHFKDNRSEAIVQRRVQQMADAYLASTQFPIQKKPNNTGLPDTLKSGIEGLSGYSMNDVNVHYNSSKPAQLQAHAYTQGSTIHVAPGQEKHLAHEAWHVVQQKQGRVKPTVQTSSGIKINDNPDLEREADVMGNAAIQAKFIARAHKNNKGTTTGQVVQRALVIGPTANMNAANMMKLADVIRIANAAHGMDAAVVAGNVDVTIEITSPGRTEISPAATQPVVAKAPGPGHDITVEIQRAYFELASVGDLLGMIAHELGVHGYNDALGNAPLAGPRWTPIPSARPGRAAAGYTIGQQNRHVSADHLDVTQVLAPGVVSAKANKYVETILHHGDAIQADAHLTAAEKLTAQRELVTSYCFDIARIVATDDRMAYVPAHWDAIREVYNDAHTYLGTTALAATPWFAGAGIKPAAQLKPDFNALGRSFVWQKIKGR